MKTAVVYYTRLGHNAVIAGEVAAALGAELHRIETPRLPGYPAMGGASFFNIPMKIRPMELDFCGYDLLVLCAPIWAWKPAPPARTFLRNARLPKRLAICFSSGGDPSQRAQEKTRQLLAGRDVELVAFGEISLQLAPDDDALRREARLFAGRLK
ncbi:hypothetical protein JXB37_01525 [candidate division WOR-3 bacterium]|nr:hypothetical protein [candidate division WOR-3 bacterium]